MSKRELKPPTPNLKVIPDYNADIGDWDVIEDVWSRANQLRPDERPKIYDGAVWGQAFRIPSDALIAAITKYWTAHKDIDQLSIYDQTMACGITLWPDDNGLIGSYRVLATNFDTAAGQNIVEAVLDTDAGYLCWWDGSTLHEVPWNSPPSLKLV